LGGQVNVHRAVRTTARFLQFSQSNCIETLFSCNADALGGKCNACRTHWVIGQNGPMSDS
jgi:hypothetical protein